MDNGIAVRRVDPDAQRRRTASENSGIEAFPLEFTGTGGEYFRVWIVNVLLTIVTFGLYTPFARRRTAQYFYGHTWVANSPLEFTAQSRRMVFGFLVLAALYIAFQLAADTGQDTVVSLFLIAGAALAPWLWGSAMRFRLGATRWRGVRLQFAAPWGEVYRASWPVLVIALIWIATTFAFGILMPDAESDHLPVPSAGAIGATVLALALTVLCIVRLEFNYKSLLVKRARVGNQTGRWKPVYGDFLRIWLATVAVFIGCMVLVGLLLALVMGGSFALLGGLKNRGFMAFVLLALLVLGMVFIGFLATTPARAWREARMFQLVWNNVGVSQVARFKCDLRAGRYIGLRVRNLLLSLLTLGFYRPFALVSEYRMKAESVTLHVKGGVDQMAGELVAQQGGIGDAMADAVGLDLVG